MSDELRNRIRRLDPMGPDVETRSVSESREMMEAVMSTPTNTKSTGHQPERDRRTLRPAAGTAGGSIAISLSDRLGRRRDGSRGRHGVRTSEQRRDRTPGAVGR